MPMITLQMELLWLGGERLRVNQALAEFLGYTIDEITNTQMTRTTKDVESLN